MLPVLLPLTTLGVLFDSDGHVDDLQLQLETAVTLTSVILQATTVDVALLRQTA